MPTSRTAVLDGLPVAVSGSVDDTMRVWDLTTGEQIGKPLTGHAGQVTTISVATTDTGVLTAATINGHPVAVTTHRAARSRGRISDHTARLWDLATGRRIGLELSFPGPIAAVELTADGYLVVCFGHDVAVITIPV